MKPTGAVDQSVRVLWDIENIGVPSNLGGVRTVERIKSFLKGHELVGPGIDTRTTVFFNPNKITDNVVRALDSAAVELIWINRKQEGADRKIVLRISQEMAVLSPQNTSFVLISSDRDFICQIQLLASAGYKIYVIHNAQHDDCKLALEMHATESFKWVDVIGVAEGEPLHTATPTEGAIRISPSKHTREIEKAAAASNIHNQSNPADFFNNFLGDFGVSNKAGYQKTNLQVGNGSNNGSGGSKPSYSDCLVEVKLVTGGCIRVDPSRLFDSDESRNSFKKACVLRWKGMFGFLAVPLSKTTEEVENVSISKNQKRKEGNEEICEEKKNQHCKLQCRLGASSDENIAAIRKALHIDENNAQKIHLCKVYSHHHVLQLDPPRSSMRKMELCRVRIGPNNKGPCALEVVNMC